MRKPSWATGLLQHALWHGFVTCRIEPCQRPHEALLIVFNTRGWVLNVVTKNPRRVTEHEP
jgi:hypothetical protein